LKVLTLLGTRPEIIRLSRVIPQLDRHCEQVLVYTGQNFDPALSDVFFSELRLRAPDVHLGIRAATFAEQFSELIARAGPLLQRVRPDRLLLLGDTNSALVAILAARMGIPVYHMEGGNRAYDDRVPEEINRRVIDHCSSVLMPYTERSAANLVREGIERERVFVTGNPIFEVLEAYAPEIDASDVRARLGLNADNQADRYFLATLHRSENVDDPSRLDGILEGFSRVAEAHSTPLIVALHPRTASRMRSPPRSPLVRILPPLGFFDFVHLEKHASLVLSDSGTVPEECAIMRVPNLSVRDVTERPETIECGSTALTGGDPADIERIASMVLKLPRDWVPPREYTIRDVSSTVARIVLGAS
jgi:UDP-N-acetylglucosamine 2-epimerase (non-hydrolysing)